MGVGRVGRLFTKFTIELNQNAQLKLICFYPPSEVNEAAEEGDGEGEGEEEMMEGEGEEPGPSGLGINHISSASSHVVLLDEDDDVIIISDSDPG